MNSVKSVFGIIKNWWGDPKKKSIIQLVFWILFFAIIVSGYRIANDSKDIQNTDSTNNSNLKTTKDINSYEYEYNIHYLNNDVLIKGTHYNNKDVFYINNDKYYIIDNEYYFAKNNLKIDISYPINEWAYENLNKIKDNFTYSNNTSYKSGMIKYEYNISSTDYNKYYNSSYTNDILIDIIVNKNIITEASINYINYKVDIKYTNINEINNLDINIEKR